MLAHQPLGSEPDFVPRAKLSNGDCGCAVQLFDEPDAMSLLSQSTEALIRVSVFAGVFTAMALWELAAPRRRQVYNRAQRWPSNLAVVALDTVVVRLLFPLSAVALAMHAETSGWGLFNQWGVPAWLAVLAAFLLLDFAIYLQHVAFHAVPALWRLHRMHHADLEFDVTTGSRFHPIEIVLSMIIKMAIVAALGVPPIAIVVFEVVLNATALFNHSNVRLHAGADRVLRLLMVTPDMHRVHHSVLTRETNANFGFNLPWWDRLFGTYRDQPVDGHEAMTIGIAEIRNPSELRLDRMLTQPFRLPADTNTIDQRSG